MTQSIGTVLVVGSTGQLGTALCAQLGSRAIPAARRQLTPETVHADLEQLAADPAAAERLIAEHKPSAVICAAGATDVERCESDNAWASAANHLGPLALARAARNIPFAFLSTDYVFDGAAGPYAETDATRPLSVYGRTKLEGELAVLDEHPSALVLRTTTVYGPDPQKKNFLYTLSRVLNSGGTMRCPTDQLATPTHVEDLATATLALLEQGSAGLVHVAGPEFLSRYDFALQACDILGLDTTNVVALTTPELNQKADRPLLGGLRIDTLNDLLGRRIMRSPAEGILSWKESLAAG
ncbi:MAG: NAD(P)-dependent oxidoreductase [Acidobacteriaceae bacterium]|nr:NAD(P)-dependent oxidoreductase [Acidobacteriaceae bacterium]